MKLKTTLSILAGLLAAACGAAQTADDILEANFAALGGKARIRAVRTLRLEATQQTGDKSVPLTIYWKRPGKLRIESPLQGLETVQAFDGERGWYTYPELPGFEAVVLTDGALEALRAQADLVEGPTLDHAAKGHRVELLGKDALAGGEAWRVLLTTAKGEVRTLWFDSTSMLQTREERKELREGREVSIESRLFDFRPVGGILFAHRVEERVRAGAQGKSDATEETSVFTIRKIDLDVDLPDALFVLPVTQSPDSAPF